MDAGHERRLQNTFLRFSSNRETRLSLADWKGLEAIKLRM